MKCSLGEIDGVEIQLPGASVEAKAIAGEPLRL